MTTLTPRTQRRRYNGYFKNPTSPQLRRNQTKADVNNNTSNIGVESPTIRIRGHVTLTDGNNVTIRGESNVTLRDKSNVTLRNKSNSVSNKRDNRCRRFVPLKDPDEGELSDYLCGGPFPHADSSNSSKNSTLDRDHNSHNASAKRGSSSEDSSYKRGSTSKDSSKKRGSSSGNSSLERSNCSNNSSFPCNTISNNSSLDRSDCSTNSTNYSTNSIKSPRLLRSNTYSAKASSKQCDDNPDNSKIRHASDSSTNNSASKTDSIHRRVKVNYLTSDMNPELPNRDTSASYVSMRPVSVYDLVDCDVTYNTPKPPTISITTDQDNVSYMSMEMKGSPHSMKSDYTHSSSSNPCSSTSSSDADLLLETDESSVKCSRHSYQHELDVHNLLNPIDGDGDKTLPSITEEEMEEKDKVRRKNNHRKKSALNRRLLQQTDSFQRCLRDLEDTLSSLKFYYNTQNPKQLTFSEMDYNALKRELRIIEASYSLSLKRQLHGMMQKKSGNNCNTSTGCVYCTYAFYVSMRMFC